MLDLPKVTNEIYTRTFPLLHESDPTLKLEPKPWIFGENPDPQRMRMIMLENMVAHKGLGLSANQIGMPVQVFSMYVTDEDGIVCFNPKIVGESDEKVAMKEGCLSFPELYLKIQRPREIWVKYQNADGDIINAELSLPIIESIFYKNSPLHDGAVIIVGNVIVASRVTLPVSKNRKINKSLGLRHKAGIGVTEESDAISIVISEETGKLSYIKNGKIINFKNNDELKDLISNDLLD